MQTWGDDAVGVCNVQELVCVAMKEIELADRLGYALKEKKRQSGHDKQKSLSDDKKRVNDPGR